MATASVFDARLTKLEQFTQNPEFREQNALAVSILENVVDTSGARPGLFLGEFDLLEARWLIARPDDRPVRIVNVLFTDPVDVYVYDREVSDIDFEMTFDLSAPDAGAIVLEIVTTAVESVDGEADESFPARLSASMETHQGILVRSG